MKITFLLPYGLSSNQGGFSISGMLRLDFEMPFAPISGITVVLPYGGEYVIGEVKYHAQRNEIYVFAEREEYVLGRDEIDLKDRIRWLKENFKFVEERDVVNLPAPLILNFNEAELAALDELCARHDLSRFAILRQSLRQYQLVANGWKLEAELPLKKLEVDEACPITYAGKFLRMRKNKNWEYAERTNASGVVVIIAVTEERKILFVEQFRPPMDCQCIELPAGLVGDKGIELETEAVRRELAEETGYETPSGVKILYLGHGPSSSGLTNETTGMYFAGGLKKMANPPKDDSEQIILHEIPLDEAQNWLESQRKGKAVDWKIYAALYFVNQLLPKSV
jgi:ADP-ribose pyrophosphatase